MRLTTKYVAEDGREFATEEACLQYEAEGIQITNLDSLVGKTIKSVKEGTAQTNYEAIQIVFEDGSKAVFVGGGYDGYGDYINLSDYKFDE